MKSILSIAAVVASAFISTLAWAGSFAQVVIYDVTPGSEAEFEQALLDSRQAYQSKSGFLNERLLGSLDNQAFKYASYAKFETEAAASGALTERILAVSQFLRRPPESHIVEVTQSFGPVEKKSQRKANDNQVGQIAHLGLFVPFNRYFDQYQTSLVDIKNVVRGRKPNGYIGEDLMLETAAQDPGAQTPYSPHPSESAKMSINYGEYQTLEDAENSYVQRHGEGEFPDPRLEALARTFFGSLQVPTRFFIFKVVDNYSVSPNAARRQPLRTKVAFRN